MPKMNNRLPSLAFVLALCGCAVRPAPQGFATRTHWYSHDLLALSPDGIGYTVRTVKNKPKGDLAFWREATKTRMTQAGYRLLGDSTLAIGSTPGALLRLAAPLGQKDYLYYIAISVHGRTIELVEAAGESSRFRAREDAILKAMVE